jgi:predicted Zn-dependent protease
MVRIHSPRLAFKGVAALAAALVLSGFAPPTLGRDTRVQDRLYEHLDHAEKALLYGQTSEAVAYAEMVLLRREITVYVDDSNAPWQIKEDAKRALRDAAVNWEDALNREVRFRFVSFPDADVVVRYAGEMRYDGKHAAGTVRWTRQVVSLGSDQFQYQVRATISLRTQSPRGGTMNYAQMLHTAGHELGHILGLEDTARQGDLMGPLRLDRPVERATGGEKNSLLTFRKQADLLLLRCTGASEFVPNVQAEVKGVVVSEPKEHVESQEAFARVARSGRRSAPVRVDRRSTKTPPRKTNFAIGGMAR